jgi:hypothetical protein
MAWEKIVQRLGTGVICCPKCRNVEIEYQENFDELEPASCPKCGWKGVGRELAVIPPPGAN